MGDGEFFIRICVHSSVLLNPKNHERVVRIDVFKTTTDEDGAKGHINGSEHKLNCMVNSAGLAMVQFSRRRQVALKNTSGVRLEGTNVDQGKRYLRFCYEASFSLMGLQEITAEDLDAAAEKAVKPTVK
ncbi:hypothetical protein Patl1_07585 [Pistacia atlantica]|uniref:Uncharacterized protein n=1 Tax=Pistacia atlantica TaxID=434234 RepID=A0ACC1AFH5_9ROSI|nr:hypothetical protein Patl1_07585 [Pistacia atlantica]